MAPGKGRGFGPGLRCWQVQDRRPNACLRSDLSKAKQKTSPAVGTKRASLKPRSATFPRGDAPSGARRRPVRAPFTRRASNGVTGSDAPQASRSAPEGRDQGLGLGLRTLNQKERECWTAQRAFPRRLRATAPCPHFGGRLVNRPGHFASQRLRWRSDDVSSLNTIYTIIYSFCAPWTYEPRSTIVESTCWPPQSEGGEGTDGLVEAYRAALPRCCRLWRSRCADGQQSNKLPAVYRPVRFHDLLAADHTHSVSTLVRGVSERGATPALEER